MFRVRLHAALEPLGVDGNTIDAHMEQIAAAAFGNTRTAELLTTAYGNTAHWTDAWFGKGRE
jgi:hypothetical protein